MIKARGLKVAAAALALGSVTLAGCVVAPAPGYYAEGGPVMVAPPRAAGGSGRRSAGARLHLGGRLLELGRRSACMGARDAGRRAAARLSHLGAASLGGRVRGGYSASSAVTGHAEHTAAALARTAPERQLSMTPPARIAWRRPAIGPRASASVLGDS